MIWLILDRLELVVDRERVRSTLLVRKVSVLVMVLPKMQSCCRAIFLVNLLITQFRTTLLSLVKTRAMSLSSRVALLILRQ